MNGFDYPVMDGYTLRVPLIIKDQLNRKFPPRKMTVETAADEGISQRNAAILEHNRTNPHDLKPLEISETILKEVIIGKGVPDFTDVNEVLDAYVLIVNNSPEVKTGERKPVDKDVLLNDMTDLEPFAMLVLTAIMPPVPAKGDQSGNA